MRNACIGIGTLFGLMLACSSRTPASDVTGGEGMSPGFETKRPKPPPAVPTFGDPLAGLSDAENARFLAGRAEFATVEDVADGLGPVFNGNECGGCHASPALGGNSTTAETRFGAIVNGVFDPLVQLGGSLLQSQGIGVITFNGQTCDFVGEQVPSGAIHAGRLTTQLFGLGLVDAVPDATLTALAAKQARETPATAGTLAIVPNLSTGGTSVGKFGWKAQVPSLFQFAGDAYVNEMGITNPQFPTENCPQGNCALLVCDPVPDPEDDGTDVRLFTDFMTLLAPPPPSSGPPNGEQAFRRIGCADCHVSELKTGSSSIAALDSRTFTPYSDFLLHDMGSLGDGITQNNATGTLMRTAPLWGARTRTQFLHDGRASNVTDAILAHEGQGAGARDRFNGLSGPQRSALVAFVSSL